MKRCVGPVLFAILVLRAAGSLAAQTGDAYVREEIISEISGSGAPYVRGEFVVFTAPGKARHVGIAFEHEQFRVIHSYQRITVRDLDNKVIDAFYFFLLEIPKNTDSIAYKIITDGLWSLDPLNPDSVYDSRSSSTLSRVKTPRGAARETRVMGNGLTRFVYLGPPGQKIRLSGTFTNWDPFIYEMTETSPGFYELELRLLPGTHYYTFYAGLTALVDSTNPARVFTQDGRAASMIVVE